MSEKIFTECPWCGASGYVGEDFEKVQDGKACWCPDCDSLFYLNPADDKRRMLLLLESRISDPSLPRPAPNKTNLRKRLSPLRYPGGKSKVIDQIYSELKTEKLGTFVELFAGGASLGLSLLEAGKIKKLVLNELDPAVYNFWYMVLNDSKSLIDCIRTHSFPTLMNFHDAQKYLKEQVQPEEAFRAWHAYSFLVVNRLSFGGLLTSGPISSKSGKALCQRWNADRLIERIRTISDMSEKIELHNSDAEELFIETIGWLDEDSTVFVDPPYYKAGPQLYREGFKDRHQALANVLNEFYLCYPSSDIILTYDDCPEVRAMYPFAEVKTLKTSWSISRPDSATDKTAS